MCGRYTRAQTNQLRDRFNVPKQEVEKLKKRYNISPSQTDVTVVEHQDGRHADVMKWGFIPPWAKDASSIFKYSTFNARSEGIFEKPLWKGAIKSRRCLVPSTGFYEWVKDGKEKRPMFIKPKDQELFAFAGIYGMWKDAEGKEWGTYSIITTTPNKEMEAVHNRMPVILKPEDEETWLEPSNDDQDLLSELMRPYRDGMLDIYEVSRDVNASRSDEPSFIVPLNSQ